MHRFHILWQSQRRIDEFRRFAIFFYVFSIEKVEWDIWPWFYVFFSENWEEMTKIGNKLEKWRTIKRKKRINKNTKPKKRNKKLRKEKKCEKIEIKNDFSPFRKEMKRKFYFFLYFIKRPVVEDFKFKKSKNWKELAMEPSAHKTITKSQNRIFIKMRRQLKQLRCRFYLICWQKIVRISAFKLKSTISSWLNARSVDVGLWKKNTKRKRCGL